MSSSEVTVLLTDDALRPLAEEQYESLGVAFELDQGKGLSDAYSLRSPADDGKAVVSMMTILFPAALLLKPILDSFLAQVGKDLAQLVRKALDALVKSPRKHRTTNRIKVVSLGPDGITTVSVEMESADLTQLGSSVSLWLPLLISRMQELCVRANGSKGSHVQVVLDAKHLLEESEGQSR